MLVQRREWDAGMDPDTAARRGFNPRDFDLGHKLRLLDGEHHAGVKNPSYLGQ
jgi:hypothetical protein